MVLGKMQKRKVRECGEVWGKYQEARIHGADHFAEEL